MIGIVSHAEDLHTREVTRHLDAAGSPWAMVDTSRFPTAVALTTEQGAEGWHGVWSDGGVAWDAADVHAMWWRRPQPFQLHGDLRPGDDRLFAHGECAAAVAGLWACMGATWVNDPDRDDAASRKMWQLQLATRVGLRVPRTCMTNDPARARAFVAAEPSGTIYKSFSATPSTWRETRPVGAADLELIDGVRYAPVIFQELVAGGVDVRVTIVGEQMFAAEIRSGESAYPYDFRVDTAHAPTSVHELPDPVRDRLLALMRVLDLRYGAVDLRVAPDGEHVFLEVNPAGQWLFVEYATGLPISAAVAGLLTGLDRDGERGGAAGA